MNKILMASVIFTAGLFLSACTLGTQPTDNATPQDNTSMQASPNPTSMTESSLGTESGQMTNSYTLSDVATHASTTDCWTAINGTVYDLTPVTSTGTHPGGPIIADACGTDGTQLFTTRNGKGPHPTPAQMGLQQLAIGTLVQ